MNVPLPVCEVEAEQQEVRASHAVTWCKMEGGLGFSHRRSAPVVIPLSARSSNVCASLNSGPSPCRQALNDRKAAPSVYAAIRRNQHPPVCAVKARSPGLCLSLQHLRLSSRDGRRGTSPTSPSLSSLSYYDSLVLPSTGLKVIVPDVSPTQDCDTV